MLKHIPVCLYYVYMLALVMLARMHVVHKFCINEGIMISIVQYMHAHVRTCNDKRKGETITRTLTVSRDRVLPFYPLL